MKDSGTIIATEFQLNKEYFTDLGGVKTIMTNGRGAISSKIQEVFLK